MEAELSQLARDRAVEAGLGLALEDTMASEGGGERLDYRKRLEAKLLSLVGVSGRWPGKACWWRLILISLRLIFTFLFNRCVEHLLCTGTTAHALGTDNCVWMPSLPLSVL